MKIVNSNLEEINESSNIRYDDIYNKIVNYLKSTIKDERILNDMLKDNEYILIQETSGDSYTIDLPNGSKKHQPIPSSVGALKTNMSIRANSQILGIRPGVALRPNFTDHQLVHELLHAISSKHINYFDGDGIVYTKTGTKIDYFDRNLNDASKENNLSSDGLNEGITELLASIITNEYTGNYPHMVVIAKLLMMSNDNLINAYFSHDLKDLEKFYTDLEEKQKVITREDLCKFNSKDVDDELTTKILVGSIEYNKSCGNEIDNDTYVGMINYLDRNYILDSGSWNDLIESYNSEEIVMK